MRVVDLTPDQARALGNKLRPMLGYLGRLKRRMNYRGFMRSDPLFDTVLRAEDFMHRLMVELHYLTCRQQTGHRRRDEGEPSDG